MKERSELYIVGQLDDPCKYSACIFRVSIKDFGRIIGDSDRGRYEVFDRKEYIGSQPPSCYSNVSCDLIGYNLYLYCSYTTLKFPYQIFQAPIHRLDTAYGKLTELQEALPIAPKPFPVVMAVAEQEQLLVYAQRRFRSLDVPPPTLEGFKCLECQLPSLSATPSPPASSVQKLSPPQFDLPPGWYVRGYAVVDNFLLISVADVRDAVTNFEFLYCKISSSYNLSHNKWEKLIMAEESNSSTYYPFLGKAEFVDGFIFSFSFGFLTAYRVEPCCEEGLLSISPPVLLSLPQFAAPPPSVDWCENHTLCFSYFGFGKRFCFVQSGHEDSIPHGQCVSISVVEVSDDMRSLTLISSGVCNLDITGLDGQLFITSCFVPLRKIVRGVDALTIGEVPAEVSRN